MVYSKAKLKNNENKASTFYQTIPNRKTNISRLNIFYIQQKQLMPRIHLTDRFMLIAFMVYFITPSLSETLKYRKLG